MNVTKDMIKASLAEMDVRAGDAVFFHSSLKSIGYVIGGADAVIDAFLETVGPEGTLALPGLCLYDWDRMSPAEIQDAWDRGSTPTYTGLIPETFRRRSGVMRSDNPTHSVTALGRHAVEITKDHENARGAEWAAGRPKWASRGAFGWDSPWDRLYKLDAKYLLIGVGFDRCTILHHVQVMYLEQVLKPTDDHARWPDFNFTMFGERLEATGVVQPGTIGSSVTRLMKTRPLVDTAMKVLRLEGPLRFS